MNRPRHIAVAEANNFHEETVFALATAAVQAAPDARLTVFAPDHWRSRSFLLDDMRVPAQWHPFAALAAEVPGPEADIDLLLVNTFPSPAGQLLVESAWGRARTVLGLVHDLDFFADPSGPEAALRRHPELILAYPGPTLPDVAAHLEEARRGRVVRLFPVLRPEPGGSTGDGEPGRFTKRSGIALPGALEFARRDYALAFQLVARTGTALRIFGRSREHGDGPKKPRDLDEDRRLMWKAVARFGITDRVRFATDVSCRDFYRTLERSRWVAVLPNQEDYLRGKLTGAVTAAMSCGVPMLVSSACYAYYTRADSAIFAPCMVEFEATAAEEDEGAPQQDARYRDLCLRTLHARDRVIEQNAQLIARLLER